jgi:hypothetical protein
MIRAAVIFFVAAFAIWLGGCGTVAAPQSLDEGLGYAEGQVSALEQSAAAAVQAGTLTPADAQTGLGYADQVVAAIQAARAAEAGGDTTTAAGKLALATSLLTQLATFLTAHGVK